MGLGVLLLIPLADEQIEAQSSGVSHLRSHISDGSSSVSGSFCFLHESLSGLWLTPEREKSFLPTTRRARRGQPGCGVERIAKSKGLGTGTMWPVEAAAWQMTVLGCCD